MSSFGIDMNTLAYTLFYSYEVCEDTCISLNGELVKCLRIYQILQNVDLLSRKVCICIRVLLTEIEYSYK